MAEIRPGLLSPDAADTLNSAVEDVARIQFDLEQARKDDDFDFPAKVTAAWYDHETDMWLCDWVEQYFDSKGRRVDLEGGRFGNTLHAPAVPIGNGSPPATFPAEVRLSFRSFNETKGPIYEFVWLEASSSTQIALNIPFESPVSTFSAINIFEFTLTAGTWVINSHITGRVLPSTMSGSFGISAEIAIQSGIATLYGSRSCCVVHSFYSPTIQNSVFGTGALNAVIVVASSCLIWVRAIGYGINSIGGPGSIVPDGFIQNGFTPIRSPGGTGIVCTKIA